MTQEEFFKKHFNDEYEDVLGIEFEDPLVRLYKIVKKHHETLYTN